MGPRQRRRHLSVAKPLRPHAGYAPGHETARRASSTTDQVMTGWLPRSQEPSSSWARERDRAVGRTRDLIQNEGWASSYVSRQTEMVAGQTFRYSAKPRVMSRLLGISLDHARHLAGEIETAFQSWGNDPLWRADWQRDLDFGGLINLLTREFFASGEGLGILRWDEQSEPDWPWRTSLQVIDADRLSNPYGRLEDIRFRHGIERDENGRHALAYHFREAHPSDPSAWGQQLRWERVPVRTEWGRPIVIHVRAKTRPDETRGVSKLVTALRKIKMLQRFSDAELQTAAVNALFAGVIYSTNSHAADDLGIQDMLQQSEARKEYYDGADPRLSDGSRVAALFPGDQFDLNTAQRPGGNYQAFQTAFLQAIASGLDMSYEQLASDWSKTNYSSGRMALVEGWRHVMSARRIVASQAGFPIMLAVVEEALDLGKIEQPPGAPDLYENPAGWLAGDWIGPGRGWVDPVKEAEGARLRIAAGLSSHEREAAEQGGDWESILGQQMDERAAFRAAGFMPSTVSEQIGHNGGPPFSADDEFDNEEEARA